MPKHESQIYWRELSGDEDPYANIRFKAQTKRDPQSGEEKTHLTIFVSNISLARLHLTLTATLEPRERGPIAANERFSEGFEWTIDRNFPNDRREVAFPRELLDPVKPTVPDGELEVKAWTSLTEGAAGYSQYGTGSVAVP